MAKRISSTAPAATGTGDTLAASSASASASTSKPTPPRGRKRKIGPHFEREAFVFLRDWRDALEDLPDADQLALYRAIADYALDGDELDEKGLSGGTAKMAWLFIKGAIKRGRDRAKAGKSGTGPNLKMIGNQNARKQNKNRTETEQKQNLKIKKKPVINTGEIPSVNTGDTDGPSEEISPKSIGHRTPARTPHADTPTPTEPAPEQPPELAATAAAMEEATPAAKKFERWATRLKDPVLAALKVTGETGPTATHTYGALWNEMCRAHGRGKARALFDGECVSLYESLTAGESVDNCGAVLVARLKNHLPEGAMEARRARKRNADAAPSDAAQTASPPAPAPRTRAARSMAESASPATVSETPTRAAPLPSPTANLGSVTVSEFLEMGAPGWTDQKRTSLEQWASRQDSRLTWPVTMAEEYMGRIVRGVDD